MPLAKGPEFAEADGMLLTQRNSWRAFSGLINGLHEGFQLLEDSLTE